MIIIILIQLIIFKISINVKEKKMLTKQGFKRPFADYVYSSPASPEKKIRTPVKKIDKFTIKKIIEKKLAK